MSDKERMLAMLDRVRAEIEAGRVAQLAVTIVTPDGGTLQAHYSGDHSPLTLIGALYESAMGLRDVAIVPKG